MSDTKSKPKISADPQAERLRAALRENLKRRKAQVKAKAKRPVGGMPDPKSASAAPTGDSPEASDPPNSAGFAPDNAKS